MPNGVIPQKPKRKRSNTLAKQVRGMSGLMGITPFGIPIIHIAAYHLA